MIGVPLRPVSQELESWCWAATAEMVLGCLGPEGVAQRAVAEAWLGHPCDPPGPRCDVALARLEDVAALYGLFGVRAHLRGRQRAGPRVVEAELRAGRPVLVGFDQGTLHLAVAWAWRQGQGVPWVSLADPAGPGPLVRERRAAHLADPGERRTWRWTWTFGSSEPGGA